MSTETQAQYQFIDKIIQHHLGENTEVNDLEFFYGGNWSSTANQYLESKWYRFLY